MPSGENGIICTLDSKYAPMASVQTMTFPNTKIQITINQSGSITAYNYGTDIQQLTSARFSITYVAAN